MTASCHGPDGEALLRVDFFGASDSYNGYVRLREIRPAGMPDPLLLAVAVTTGGSDSLFETAMIGERDERLVDLWPRHFRTSVLDELCVGALGPSQPVGVAGFVFIWSGGADEWHCSAHRYRATLYEWKDEAFAPAGAQISPRAVDDWSQAAKEMGFACSGVLHSFRDLEPFR